MAKEQEYKIKRSSNKESQACQQGSRNSREGQKNIKFKALSCSFRTVPQDNGIKD